MQVYGLSVIFYRRIGVIAGIGILSLLVLAVTGCTDSSIQGKDGLYMSGHAQTANQVTDANSHPAGESTPATIFIVYVATPPDVVDAMLKAARVTSHDVVCDLGCGDGRIPVTAARRYGCRGIGYDIDHLRVDEAIKNAEQHHVSHLVRIEQKDVMQADLDGVTVVTLYLGYQLNARLLPRLAELGPGVRVVSHDFPLADIPPDKVITVNSRTDRREHKIYLWNCPIKVGNSADVARP